MFFYNSARKVCNNMSVYALTYKTVSVENVKVEVRN